MNDTQRRDAVARRYYSARAGWQEVRDAVAQTAFSLSNIMQTENPETETLKPSDSAEQKEATR